MKARYARLAHSSKMGSRDGPKAAKALRNLRGTLEGRVTRVPICLSAVMRDFFRGLNRVDCSAFRAETIRDSRNSCLQLFTKGTDPGLRYLRPVAGRPQD